MNAVELAARQRDEALSLGLDPVAVAAAMIGGDPVSVWASSRAGQLDFDDPVSNLGAHITIEVRRGRSTSSTIALAIAVARAVLVQRKRAGDT